MNNIHTISGEHPGPTVTIMGSVHGNERVGGDFLPLLKALIDQKKLRGTLHLILGNPTAYDRNTRFVDTDLNRLFGEPFEHEKHGSLTVEAARALEIAPFLADSDFLLDIHSTIKSSIPFVYCEPTTHHLEFARLFNVDYVVSAAKGFRPPDLISSADNFVDFHGGLGLTYEAGWSEDSSNIELVSSATQRFLQKTDNYDFGVSLSPSSPKHLVIYDVVIASDKSFEPARDFSNFDSVISGDTLATDQSGTITAMKDSMIIFPKKKIIPGQVALYLARNLTLS